MVRATHLEDKGGLTLAIDRGNCLAACRGCAAEEEKGVCCWVLWGPQGEGGEDLSPVGWLNGVEEGVRMTELAADWQGPSPLELEWGWFRTADRASGVVQRPPDLSPPGPVWGWI